MSEMKANGLDLVGGFAVNEKKREGVIRENTLLKTKWPAFLRLKPAGVRPPNPDKWWAECSPWNLYDSRGKKCEATRAYTDDGDRRRKARKDRTVSREVDGEARRKIRGKEENYEGGNEDGENDEEGKDGKEVEKDERTATVAATEAENDSECPENERYTKTRVRPFFRRNVVRKKEKRGKKKEEKREPGRGAATSYKTGSTIERAVSFCQAPRVITPLACL
ncbi:hypothetical protein KM043_015119 [Ampulex compressa]|nr:hypothetical protein KM043_015119 [Ampulex compressa]